MCELFGVTSSKKILLNDMLKEFFSHGVDHPHGWGMAFFYGNAVSLEKQPETSCKSNYLKQRLRVNVDVAKMLAHIRLATRGTMDYENTHPFVMRDHTDRTWTLEHNGTIFDCDSLNPYINVQQGQTDSERILCYIVDKMNQEQEHLKRSLSQEERFHIMDQIVCEISVDNKVNLLIYDGELLYVHTNYQSSLYRCRKGKAVVFSTRTLDKDKWEAVPMNTLLAYQDGNLQYTGTNHGHEFHDNEEQMRLLFLDYAHL